MSQSTVWNIDPSHSVVEFTVRHMMIAKVKGRFGSFKGQIVGDPEDLTGAKVEVVVELASIDTRSEDRDNHLRSADFFDVERFPEMRFTSKEIKKTGEGSYAVEGDLTIRDVTRPVTLNVTYEGSGKDPWGGERAAFSATARINRKDFGLTWNAPLETGGVLVGEDVDIAIEVEAVKAS